jgi:hypothetical protein
MLIRPKTTCFHAPEGAHRGKITAGKLQIDQKHNQTRECVQLTIELDEVESDKRKRFLVNANFWGSQGVEFMNLAEALLKEKAEELSNGEGELVEGKLDLLVDKRVELEVVLTQRKGHEHAYRKVVNLKPLSDTGEQPQMKVAA